MSRVTVTERGRKLQKEVLGEVGEIKEEGGHRRSPSHSHNNSQLSPRSMTTPKLSQIHDFDSDMHLTIHQTIVKELSYLEEDENNKTPKLKLPTLAVENKYLKSKVDKLVNDLNKDLKPKQKLDSSSLPLLSTLSHSNVSSKAISIQDQTGSIPSSYGVNTSNFSTDNDRFMASQHYKILHLESTIGKMLERHTESQKKTLETASKVLANYQKKNKRIVEANHKPPVFLDNIKEENADAIDILMKKTNSYWRRRKRIAQYWRQKYETDWTKYDDLKTNKFEEHLTFVRDHKGKKEDYYDYLITSNKNSISGKS